MDPLGATPGQIHQLIATAGSVVVAALAFVAFIVAWKTRAKDEGGREQAVSDLKKRLDEHVAEADKIIPEFHELKAIVAGQVEASKNLGRNIDRLFDLFKETHEDIRETNKSVQRLVELILTTRATDAARRSEP